MAFGKPQKMELVISAPNMQRITFRIAGENFVVHRFSNKARQQMERILTADQADKIQRRRKARNFQEDYGACFYKDSVKGWYGIKATAFRAAMVRACSTVGMQMTTAKLAVFIVADGYDYLDDTVPLVRIHGKPELFIAPASNTNGGTDLRARPRWRQWHADVTVEFDADLISASSVANLLARVGRQVGIGEGRPFSSKSCGQDWGRFNVVPSKSTKRAGVSLDKLITDVAKEAMGKTKGNAKR